MPAVSPFTILANPSAARSSGIVVSMTGRIPVVASIAISDSSSERVPIVEPTTDSWRKKTRLRSAGGLGPLVAPQTTSVGVSTSSYVRREGEVIRHNFGWTLVLLGYLILIGVFYYYVLPDAMRP